MPSATFEEIVPRELKPALLELDGISRESVESHYKLYEGYVSKRNEILRALDGVDLASANQTYSAIRALKVELRTSQRDQLQFGRSATCLVGYRYLHNQRRNCSGSGRHCPDSR